MISTGGTLVEAAKQLLKAGANEVYAGATHPIFAGQAVSKITSSPITEVIVTDTLPISPCAAGDSKITVLSLASLLGEAIRRNFFHLSVSKLFNSVPVETVPAEQPTTCR
jgi:ribose-phosphate pyrophosphokinase